MSESRIPRLVSEDEALQAEHGDTLVVRMLAGNGQPIMSASFVRVNYSREGEGEMPDPGWTWYDPRTGEFVGIPSVAAVLAPFPTHIHTTGGGEEPLVRSLTLIPAIIDKTIGPMGS